MYVAQVFFEDAFANHCNSFISVGDLPKEVLRKGDEDSVDLITAVADELEKITGSPADQISYDNDIDASMHIYKIDTDRFSNEEALCVALENDEVSLEDLGAKEINKVGIYLTCDTDLE